MTFTAWETKAYFSISRCKFVFHAGKLCLKLVPWELWWCNIPPCSAVSHLSLPSRIFFAPESPNMAPKASEETSPRRCQGHYLIISTSGCSAAWHIVLCLGLSMTLSEATLREVSQLPAETSLIITDLFPPSFSEKSKEEFGQKRAVHSLSLRIGCCS